MTLFVARDAKRRPQVPPDLGWSRWAKGGVEIEAVPGTHLGILDEPHVGVLADRLSDCLAAFEEAGQASS